MGSEVSAMIYTPCAVTGCSLYAERAGLCEDHDYEYRVFERIRGVIVKLEERQLTTSP